MKIRSLFLLCCLFATSAQAQEPLEPVVYRWDSVCNHTTSTEYFVLPAYSRAKIEVDFSGCDESQLGSLLFFGNYATKTSSRQLSSKHKVRLHLTGLYSSKNVAEPTISSDSGSILADVAQITAGDALNSPRFVLVAENMNRKKDIKIRLRAQLIAP